MELDGSSTRPEDDQSPDATAVFPGLTISDTEGTAGGALAAGAEGATYISASPGTFSDADRVTLTNLANSESLNVPTRRGRLRSRDLEALTR